MAYSAGVAYLTVVPSFKNIEREFRKETEKLAKEIDEAIKESIPEGMREASKQARGEGERAGSAYASAFAAAIRRPIEQALKDLPEIELDANTSEADRKIHELRQDLETLRDAKVGVGVDFDLDEGEFFAEVARLKKVAEDLERDGVTVEVRYNAQAARQQLEKIGQVAKQVSEGGKTDGEQYGGAWGVAARRRIAAALTSIGDIELTASSTSVDAELADLHRRLAELSKKDVDVDIPASKYMAELEALIAELQAIEDTTVNIRILTNVRAAKAELESLAKGAKKQGEKAGTDFGGSFNTASRNAIRAALAALPEVELKVDSTDADREVAYLRAQLARLLDVEIDVDMDAATVLAQLNRIQARMQELSAEDVRIDVHTNLLAAAGELAAIQTMINRLDGQDIDIDVDTNGLRSLATNAGISMSRLGTLISLGASIGTAIVPAAASAAAAIGAIATAASAGVIGIGVLALGLIGVVKAVQALNAFQKQSTKSGVSLGASQDRVANALDTVRAAQRGLARAERERQQAVEDLSKAQQEAVQQLEDMALAVRDNALAQRQARLDEIEAKEELDRLLLNPRATEEEREQARITYEQKLLQIDELAVQQKRLAAEKADADKKGVQGSDKVLAAQERILAANDSLVSAQESLAQSQRSLAQAYEKTGVAGGEALSNLQEAMNALSPAGQAFALFIFGLRGEFKKLQAAAETGLLPGLEQGIRNLLPFLPQLEILVGKVGVALGEIFVGFTEDLKDPIWQKFFGYMADTAVPALKGMAKFGANIAKGFAGIIMGLTGFNGPIGEGLLKWSEGFAAWASTLDTNKGWQRFLDYVRENGPLIIDLFGRMWEFTKKIVIAAAPIGTVVVKAFATLFEWLNKIDADTWTTIIAAVGAFAAALLVASVITAAIATGITGAIIGAVAIIGAGLALLYQKVKPFRDAVDITIKAIAVAASWLWEAVLKPTFAGIVAGVRGLITIFRTLYDQIFVHVFALSKAIFFGFWESLKTVFGLLEGRFGAFRTVFQVVFGLFRTGVQTAASIFSWLWDHVMKPVFGYIGLAFEVLKAVFQVAFGLFQIGVKIAAAVFTWFYDHAVKPVIDKLRPLFTWLANVIQRDVVPPIRTAMTELGKVFDYLLAAAKTPIRFMINTVLNDGLLRGYNSIAKFFKVKPDDVRINLPAGFAVGGAVDGPGTGTSDSILARLSKGEHVWTAAEVDAAGGHSMVHAMRRMVLDGVLPGFARGGPIGKGGTGDGIGDWLSGLRKKATDAYEGITDFLSDPAGSLRKLSEKLLDLVPGKDSQMVQVLLGLPKKGVDVLAEQVKNLFKSNVSQGAGITGGGLGWERMMQIIRAPFPGLALHSGFRPGSTTLSGNRSYHAVGRAVDIPPRMDVFNWLAGHFPDSREIIFSPANGRQIWNGKPHMYSGAVRGEHWDHVHWAYDDGGYLPPGYSTVFNGTGRPEPVLTDRQWRDINLLTRGGDGSSTTYAFEFRDTTLDASKLRAMQDRESALARQGRAR